MLQRSLPPLLCMQLSIIVTSYFYAVPVASSYTLEEYWLGATNSTPNNHRTYGELSYSWPVKRVCTVGGEVIIGGLMMVHEREDSLICGPIMPQGGIQSLEAMLYTLDYINNQSDILPGFKLGAHILDDCDKYTYGLEQAVDFIKGEIFDYNIYSGVKLCTS